MSCLIIVLELGDNIVKNNARKALQEIASANSIEGEDAARALIKILQDEEDANIPYWAGYELIKLASPEINEIVIRNLVSQDIYTRKKAAWVVAQIIINNQEQSTEIEKFLVKLMESTKIDKVTKGLMALRDIVGQITYIFEQKVARKRKGRKEKTSQELGNSEEKNKLKQEQQELKRMRKKWLMMLGLIGNTEFLKMLENILQSNSVQCRRLVIEVLLGIRHPKTLSALIDALNDTDLTVRLLAINSLWKIQNPIAIPALTLLLKDKEEEVRYSAKKALRAFVITLEDEDIIVVELLGNLLEKNKKEKAYAEVLSMLKELKNGCDMRSETGKAILEALERVLS